MGPGFGEVASGEWLVASLKKKQIPRSARNDNSRAFGWAGSWVRPVGHAGWPARSRAEARPLHLEPPQLERWGADRVFRVWRRAGSGSCSCR